MMAQSHEGCSAGSLKSSALLIICNFHLFGTHFMICDLDLALTPLVISVTFIFPKLTFWGCLPPTIFKGHISVKKVETKWSSQNREQASSQGHDNSVVCFVLMNINRRSMPQAIFGDWAKGWSTMLSFPGTHSTTTSHFDGSKDLWKQLRAVFISSVQSQASALAEQLKNWCHLLKYWQQKRMSNALHFFALHPQHWSSYYLFLYLSKRSYSSGFSVGAPKVLQARNQHSLC